MNRRLRLLTVRCHEGCRLATCGLNAEGAVAFVGRRVSVYQDVHGPARSVADIEGIVEPDLPLFPLGCKHSQHSLDVLELRRRVEAAARGGESLWMLETPTRATGAILAE